MYILSHACVYREHLHIRYIYTQLHPYIYTPAPIPFTYTNQPMIEHIDKSNPTRVPYTYIPFQHRVHLAPKPRRLRYNGTVRPTEVRCSYTFRPMTLCMPAI